MFVFAAEVSDPAIYADGWTGAVLDELSPVVWRPLRAFLNGELILYPSGLLDLLSSPAARATSTS
jgi:hypothetical protein